MGISCEVERKTGHQEDWKLTLATMSAFKTSYLHCRVILQWYELDSCRFRYCCDESTEVGVGVVTNKKNVIMFIHHRLAGYCILSV
jgi:hypothetical protein